MSNPDTAEKTKVVGTQSSPRRRKSIWRWQWLVAPLMGVSIVLHIGLLFVPLPTTELVPEEEVAEEEPIPEEEEVIDLLAVSDILPPEPPPEEPAAEEPPPETPPPANPDIPPDPEQIEELLSEEVPEEFPEETEQTPSFNPAKQQEVIGRTGDINREFDQTDAFPGNVVGLPGGPEEWDTDKVNCFFAVLDFPGNHYELWPEAGLLKFFLRNNGLIVQEDLPATYPEADIIPVAPYCGEPLYLIEENGEPVMFVSVIPIGVGGSSGLLIFWTSDPSVSG